MSERLLLSVDDNIDDALLLRHACKKAPVAFQFLTVSDGSKAIAYFADAQNGRARFPDLVLLDLSMPIMTGFEVLMRLREDLAMHRPTVSVFTSSENRDDIIGAYDRGADYYVAKPPDIASLTTLVRAIDEAFRANLAHPWDCLLTFPTFKPKPRRISS
jgi:CheY-like chemotaxis protein